MNILIVNYEYPPIGGGAASASKQMAEEMTRQGHFVGVLTSSYHELRGEKKEGEVSVYRCKSVRKQQFQSNIFEMLSYIFTASFVVGRLIRKWKIDHIIVYFSFPGGPVGLVGKLFYKTPYIISLRGSDVPGAEAGLQTFHFFLKPLRRLILHKSQAVVANSLSLMQLAYKSDPIQYKIIPNGVDTAYYCPSPVITYVQQPVQLLFVGRLQRQKNLFYLLDCLKELKNKTNKPFVFSIAGDGALRKELELITIKLGINEIITFYGWLDKAEILTLYQRSDCIVNLSFNEGMSNVLLEAMACGLPVIASNVTGNDVLVENKLTGYLFDLEKPEDLIQLLLSVVEDPGLFKTLGITARNHVIENYSWQKVAAEYVFLMT
jgi:glycosyltransferase involved in cell wall biosynthesis